MLEAELEQAGLLKQLVLSVKDVVQEANVQCSPSDGLRMQAMDAAHVALAEWRLLPPAFARWRCTEYCELGLNFAALAKVLASVGAEDRMQLSLRKGKLVQELELAFAPPRGGRSSEFTLKLLELAQDELSVPELDYAVLAELDAREFRKLCGDFGALGSDTVELAVQPGELCWHSRSGEFGGGTVRLGCGGPGDPLQRLEVGASVRQEFALRYLGLFAKACPLAPQVELAMQAGGVPMRCTFQLGPRGFLRFYLAPKLEDSQV